MEALSNGSADKGHIRYVLLMKDEKPICRTRHTHSSDVFPSDWSITGFQRQCPKGLQRFQTFPDAESDHQSKEWRTFLYFLQKHKMVAIVKNVEYDLYISPSKGHEYRQADVLYRKRPKQDESLNKCQPLGSSKPLPAIIDDDSQKNFIRADPFYLTTLAQTHAAWVFGAIAEFVDNARDAKSTRLDISIQHFYLKTEGKKIPVLSMVDDGHGMSHPDIVRMLSFGHKQPVTNDVNHIGRFGIGFKTGATKLGQDALVLTQTLNSRSVAFLSYSFNKNKDNIEIPIVSYCKQGQFMEVDSSVQSEASANLHLKAIKEHSPFNEYLIGEKLGLFSENGTGTQIYVWNLETWGSNYCLDWESGNNSADSPQQGQGDILIRNRRIRSRPGQISQEVPLDYSLQAYLQVIFLEPHMKIRIQGTLVESWPLAKFLKNTKIVKGSVMGKSIHLTLGYSQIEAERANGGLFLYWHGRLIEAYKRVGGMIHNADIGRGVIGVVDVSDLMNDEEGHVWVHNNKQGFVDCEAYVKLEEWLGSRLDEYWDDNHDKIQLKKRDARYKFDREWVQCYKCRKWRMLTYGFDSSSLPKEWFCYMHPFNGLCSTPQQESDPEAITVGSNRSDYGNQIAAPKKIIKHTRRGTKRQLSKNYSGYGKQAAYSSKKKSTATRKNCAAVATKHDVPKKLDCVDGKCASYNSLDDSEGDSTEMEMEVEIPQKPILKRLRRGLLRRRK